VPEGGGTPYAEAVRAAYALRFDAAPRPRRTAGSLTVERVVRDYITWLEANRSTARDAEMRANALIIPQLGPVLVSELTAEMITEWMTALAASGAILRGGHRRPPPATREEKRRRKSTSNRTLTILKASLSAAFRSGLVDDDKEWRRVKPFDRTAAPPVGFLDITESQRLINAASVEDGFRDLVTAALHSGARYGELRALRVRDFAHGKLHVTESKSGKPRWIALTAEATEFFTQLAAGRNPNEPLLLRKGRAWEKSDQATPMRLACERARIDPPVTFHGLRHSYSSLCVQSGMSLSTLARNLGHASTRMTERYSHLSDSAVDQEIRAHAPKFGLSFKGNVRTLG
jgi:integrase